MIYECVFFSLDLVLSLVAVLIVPGGFKGGFLFIGPRFLPLWAELADPSPVLFEKRGVRAGDLSPWLDPRPLGWGALAGKAEILARSPPPLPFGTRVPDCSLAGELVAAFFAGRGLLVSSSGGRFKKAYELLNLRALKISPVNKMNIIHCMDKIFCVEFQREPLKFHTKYLIHTLKDTIFIQHWNFKSSWI